MRDITLLSWRWSPIVCGEMVPPSGGGRVEVEMEMKVQVGFVAWHPAGYCGAEVGH